MILALLSITVVYLFLIGRFVFGFDKVKAFQFQNVSPNTQFSIIIPFRNEEKNLENLLQSLSQLKYPSELFEVIIVNDASHDNSTDIICKFLNQNRLKITLIDSIRNSNSPKKDAITTAISIIKNEWIITTDADCVFHNNWLKAIDAFIQKKQPKMVVAPVAFKSKKGFLHSFQTLDFLSLIGATIGGFGIKKPFLCNGANLIYKKELFLELNGFKGNENIASGDDIFLMEKVVKTHPKHLFYLKHKHAIVTTNTQATFTSLMSQRKRWAAKTSSYSNGFGKLVGSIVLLMNFSVLATLLLSVFGIFSFKSLGYIFLIKFSIDLWLIQKAANFFNQQNHLKYYVLSSVLYPFFNVYIAISSWFGGYRWKGRHFQK